MLEALRACARARPPRLRAGPRKDPGLRRRPDPANPSGDRRGRVCGLALPPPARAPRTLRAAPAAPPRTPTTRAEKNVAAVVERPTLAARSSMPSERGSGGSIRVRRAPRRSDGRGAAPRRLRVSTRPSSSQKRRGRRAVGTVRDVRLRLAAGRRVVVSGLHGGTPALRLLRLHLEDALLYLLGPASTALGKSRGATLFLSASGPRRRALPLERRRPSLSVRSARSVARGIAAGRIAAPPRFRPAKTAGPHHPVSSSSRSSVAFGRPRNIRRRAPRRRRDFAPTTAHCDREFVPARPRTGGPRAADPSWGLAGGGRARLCPSGPARPARHTDTRIGRAKAWWTRCPLSKRVWSLRGSAYRGAPTSRASRATLS